MNDLPELPHGPCWACGEDTVDRCDFPLEPDTYDAPLCNRWVCDDHAVIEAQGWDKAGWDGVDVRCREHLALAFDTRDLLRGRYLPPPPPSWVTEG